MKLKLTSCSFLLLAVLQSGSGQQQPRVFEKTSLAELFALQKQEKKSSITFLSEDALMAKMVHIDKGEHAADFLAFDRVCYIAGGMGKLQAGNTTISVQKGSTVFVPRNVARRFYDITSSMDVCELISKENKNINHSPAASFSLEQIESGRSPGNNVWNSFLKTPSMIFGLYMLPQKLNGDSALVHRWDEVNLITKGSGKFQVGKDVMDIRPGDIIYVRKGNAHFFHSLAQDLDILIFFEKRSIEDE